MESQKLEIIVHSAKNLEDVKFFGTMDPYAMFCIAEGGTMSQAYKTNVAKKAGSCPVWNNSMEFQVDPTRKNCVLHCEIQHDGKLFDRLIGEVEIPFKELLAGDASRERVSYPVKTSYGEVKGEIILSHKFIGVLAPVISSNTDGSKITDNGTSVATKKKDGTEKKKDGMLKKKKDGMKENKKDGKKKKKDGMMKKIAKNIGTKVATEVALAAGTVGLVIAADAIFGGNVDEDEDEDDEDADEDEDEGDLEDEDEDEDENEDEDEDGDKDEDEDEDEDEDDDDDY